MHKSNGYRTLTVGLSVAICLLAANGAAWAQQLAHNTPSQLDIYCSGTITDQPVAKDIYVISGEDSGFKSSFTEGDAIYINTGTDHGTRVGDQFEVVRPVTDVMAVTPWFKYQTRLSRAMGTRYDDIGLVRVVHVNAKTSTVEVSLSCDRFQRGDLIRPFKARPVPQFHNTSLDPFAAPSGKKTAMVVSAKDYMVLNGTGKIMYVNLGGQQGVRIGDYFRVFRYQGSYNDTNYQVKKSAYKMDGYGGTPVPYLWSDLPRQVLGEGIVLRMGPNSSTVLLTNSREEIFAGDYVEVE